MTFFRVNRLWRDDPERNYSEFKDFGSFGDAKRFANTCALKEGEVWIEQREPGRHPVNTDPKGNGDPMTREHLHELRQQIRSLTRKTKPEEDA